MSDRRQEQVSRAHEPIGPLTSDTMDETRAAVFTGARPLLFAIAYRMLGSVADAEDLVQDAYLRWQQAHGEEIRAPHAYLTTIVTRLAINQLQSARHQRESYVGPWLPEPLVTEDAPDPAEPIELAESLSMAFMLMLERLSPIERAVLLLHDVFDFEYGEIARIVDKSEANCRQLLSRAKKHLGKAEARFDADPRRRSGCCSASTPPPTPVTSTAWSPCSPRTSRCGRMVVARRAARRSRQFTAPRTSRGSWLASGLGTRRWSGPSARPRSTGSRVSSSTWAAARTRR